MRECGTDIEAAIVALANVFDDERPCDPNPFGNGGVVFESPAFTARGYYWGDDEQIASLPNFTWRDLCVTWYKYIGRGMKANRELRKGELREMLTECMAAIAGRCETCRATGYTPSGDPNDPLEPC